MDRTELMAHIEEQIAFIKANVPAKHGRAAAVRNLGTIRKGLETHSAKLAVEGAREFLREIEDKGGVVRGTRVGPKDEVSAILYSDEAARQNHQYALWLLETVQEVTDSPSPVNGAADGGGESQDRPGVVTAEQWQRAFGTEGPA